MSRPTLQHVALGSLGLLAGLLAGALVVGLAPASVIHQPAADAASPFIEATHLPPLLTRAGETVDLRYDVYCSAAGNEETEDGCDASGSVFVRPGEAGSFEEIVLELDANAAEGRYVAHVPRAVATSRDGFSYYATLTSNATGATTTLPAGGSASPQRSLPLGEDVDVRLGTHVFGTTRAPDRRVVDVAWGDAEGEIGLEQGQGLAPIGGSSFDVARDGTVTVLDEAHRRLLRWLPGRKKAAEVPVAVNGTLADIAVADDGSTYVLESTAAPGRPPLVREISRDGKTTRVASIAERSASRIRIGPSGPVAYQEPSSEWRPVIDGAGTVDPDSQLRRGRMGRPLPGGGEILVLRDGNEIRAAIVGPDGSRRRWRVTSDTPIAEVQLAEPIGSRLVLVFRVYTDDRDEFVVLLLGKRGAPEKFSLDSADWAEAAPLSRFRLAGGSLYRLGSTSGGIFVDRYDLEVS